MEKIDELTISRIERARSANMLPEDRSREANLFSILEYGDSYETRGTRFIRWLCDPTAEHQCEGFIIDRLFSIAAAGRTDLPLPGPVDPKTTIAFAEATIGGKRNDVVVKDERKGSSRSKTLTIEHKTNAKESKTAEGILQRPQYWETINGKFSSDSYDNYFIFLTPTGESLETPKGKENEKSFTSWVFMSYKDLREVLEKAIAELGLTGDNQVLIRHYIDDLKFHERNNSPNRKEYIRNNILNNFDNWSIITDETADSIVSLGIALLGGNLKTFAELETNLSDTGTQFANTARRISESQDIAGTRWDEWTDQFSGTENHLKVLVEHVWDMFMAMQKSTRVLNEGIDVFLWMLDKHKKQFLEEVQSQAKRLVEELKNSIESGGMMTLNTHTKRSAICEKPYPELSVSFAGKTDGVLRPAVMKFYGKENPRFRVSLQCNLSNAKSPDMEEFLNRAKKHDRVGLKIEPKTSWRDTKDPRKTVLICDIALNAKNDAIEGFEALLREYTAVVLGIGRS